MVGKSTVPVGTGEYVRALIEDVLAQRGLASLRFSVVSNPEFLREGTAVDDCMNPDRNLAPAQRSRCTIQNV